MSETPTAIDAERPLMVRRGFLVDAADWIEDWYRELPSSHELPAHYEVVDRWNHDLQWAEPRPYPLPQPAPRRHRTGLCFENESSEMREACVDSIGALLDATDAVVHEARHQYNGYHTDLVYADIDPHGLRDRDAMTTGTHPIHDPFQRFQVWRCLVEHGPMFREDAVENGKYSDPAKNRKHLDWLLDHGYIARTSTGYVDAVTPPEIATLHAVELKLRDWQTALEQAARANSCEDDHLPARMRDRFGYADYRWVALDAGAIQPALENQDAFHQEGVGLLAVTEGGSVHKLIDAEYEPRGRYTRDRAYLESQVWSHVDVDAYLDDTHEVDRETRTMQPDLKSFTTTETES